MEIVKGHIPKMQAGIKLIQQEQDHAQIENFRVWISSTNFVAQQSDVIRRRHVGTGRWFLDRPEFTKWLDKSCLDKTLLCTGMPGTGKTMLAAIAIDHLSKEVRSGSIGVAWLYCNYKTRAKQTADALLKAILQQLLTPESPDVVTIAKELQKQHEAQGTRPDTEDLRKTLQAIFAEFATVYIVIDALDECSIEDGTRSQLLGHLDWLQSGADVRLLVTSRHIPDISEHYRDASKLEVRAHDEDVRSFLDGQLGRLPRCVQRDAELQLMIQDKITEQIDGM
jgi:Cdc6-like AAA superfamily ATPase